MSPIQPVKVINCFTMNITTSTTIITGINRNIDSLKNIIMSISNFFLYKIFIPIIWQKTSDIQTEIPAPIAPNDGVKKYPPTILIILAPINKNARYFNSLVAISAVFPISSIKDIIPGVIKHKVTQ